MILSSYVMLYHDQPGPPLLLYLGGWGGCSLVTKMVSGSVSLLLD